MIRIIGQREILLLIQPKFCARKNKPTITMTVPQKDDEQELQQFFITFSFVFFTID